MTLLKIILTGASEIGKTCLLNRYMDDSYAKTSATIGADFKVKNFNRVRGLEGFIQVWDTAGKERFRSHISSYYKNTSVAILAYDPYSTANKLDKWLSEIKQFIDPNVPIIIVSTKSDLQNEIQTKPEDVTAAIEKLDITSRVHGSIISTSAKIGTGVDSLFSTVVAVAVENMPKTLDQSDKSPTRYLPNTNSDESLVDNCAEQEEKLDTFITKAAGLREEVQVDYNRRQLLPEANTIDQSLTSAEKTTSPQFTTTQPLNRFGWGNFLTWFQSSEPEEQSGCFVHMLPFFPEDTKLYKANYIAFRGEEGLRTAFIEADGTVINCEINNSDPLYNKINGICVNQKLCLTANEVDSLIESYHAPRVTSHI